MASCSANRSALRSANCTMALPSAMPAALLGLGIITSIASPSGCQRSASGRTPPISTISGKAALTARAARMVLTCRPRSLATPTGSGRGIWASGTTRHRDAEMTWSETRLNPDSGGGGGGAGCAGGAATSSTRAGAASSAPDRVVRWPASGHALPPTTKKRAAGATSAAMPIDGFRRLEAKACRPTRAPYG